MPRNDMQRSIGRVAGRSVARPIAVASLAMDGFELGSEKVCNVLYIPLSALRTPHFIISRVNQIDQNRSERDFVITLSVPHEDSLILAFGNIVVRMLASEEFSAGLLESFTVHAEKATLASF